ncbi:MAG: hypothetical protein V2I82_03330, partial [Halieaceae bacterium]|nr:hypothetical protein [Halieaceae bacterium]
MLNWDDYHKEERIEAGAPEPAVAAAVAEAVSRADEATTTSRTPKAAAPVTEAPKATTDAA